MGHGVHAEGQLLARVAQQLLAFGEGLGDHLALLDPLGLVIALPRQPGDTEGTGGGQLSQLGAQETHSGWGHQAGEGGVPQMGKATPSPSCHQPTAH